MKEGQKSTGDMRSEEKNLFSYLLPFKTMMLGTPGADRYKDFCTLPLEQKRLAFERMSPKEQLEAVLYRAEDEVVSFAIAVPFFRALPEKVLRKGIDDIEKLAETVCVLQATLREKRNKDRV